jgi:hypothetical protein
VAVLNARESASRPVFSIGALCVLPRRRVGGGGGGTTMAHTVRTPDLSSQSKPTSSSTSPTCPFDWSLATTPPLNPILPHRELQRRRWRWGRWCAVCCCAPPSRSSCVFPSPAPGLRAACRDLTHLLPPCTPSRLSRAQSSERELRRALAETQSALSVQTRAVERLSADLRSAAEQVRGLCPPAVLLAPGLLLGARSQ